MKSYAFKVILEQDKWPDAPDEQAIWRAYVPALEGKGVATWGRTKEEALKSIQEVLKMVMKEMSQEGTPIPVEAIIAESQEPLVAVTIP